MTDYTPPLRLEGIIQVRGHAVEICGPETGHTVRAIAYCDDERRAKDIFRACNLHRGLVAALRAFAALRNSGLLIEGDAAVSTVLDQADAILAEVTKDPSQ